MAFLEVRKIEKKYRDFTLSLSLEAEEGEFLTVIGPSGSGKSTLLGLIAGLSAPDHGMILLDDENITEKRIQDRHIGMVFQDFSLFSSMSVEKNIRFGMTETNGRKQKEMAEKLLEMVGLPGYGKRSVASLSGGEAQRVALARAIASEPRILLLDEPLSALDAPMRKHLRAVIRAIHDTLGITMIYVTHDIEEAYAISDRIVILRSGTVAASGSAEELYRRPVDLFTAFFTGEGTALPAHLVYENTDGSIFFRPENAAVSETPLNPADYPMHIIFNDAEIVSAEFNGSDYLLGLSYRGCSMLAKTSVRPRRKTVSILILREALRLL